MKNLKAILNDVLGQSSFLQEEAFTSSQDPAQIQMVAIANRAVGEIRTYYPWRKLRKSHQITLQDGVLDYPLPDDFDQIATESLWREDSVQDIVFPTSNRDWAYLKAGNPGTADKYYARLQGGMMAFAAVTDGDVVNFDYQSKYAVLGADQVEKEYFTQDTDTWLLFDDTLTLATKAFWKLEKEMMSGPVDMQGYRRRLRQDIARDTGAVTIRPVDGNRTPYRPPVADV